VIATLAAGALAGIIAGAVAGIGARSAMRMVADGVADSVGVTTEFTVPGTLAIVISGMLAGAPAGVLFNAIADRLPGPPRLRGLLFGLILLAAIGPFFLRTEEFFSLGRVLLFVPLFPLFGIVLGLAIGQSRSIASRLPSPARTGVAVAAALMIGLVFFAVVAAVFGLPGGLVM